MLSKLRRRTTEEQGFTLIELLVVILIIGILAAIAIPSFLSQTSKAHDAAAKSQAVTAQTAAETLATDNNGAYGSSATTSYISPAALDSIEKTLVDTSGSTLLSAGFDSTVDNGTSPTDDATNSYYVTSTAATSGDTFTIARHGNGTVTRTCTPAGKGGCPSSGTW